MTWNSVLPILSRYRFTIAIVTVMLILGVATGTLWSPLLDKDWYEQVAYGLPSFQEGRWWTVITGSFFALIPLQYLPVAGGFAIMVGFAEHQLGTKRTALITVLAQFVGVVGAAALLAVLSQTAWAWAQHTATSVDVGFSAGAVGALAAASAALRAPWRGRLRAVLIIYVIVSILFIGVLWDLEHFLALAVGLPLGPRLAGRRARLGRPHVSRHEIRLAAAAVFWISAALVILAASIAVEGPFGAFGQPGESLVAVLPAVVLDVAIGFGLRRGSRLWWRVAVFLTVLSLVLQILAGIFIMQAEVALEPGIIVLTGLFDLLALAVLLFGRPAFRNPGRRHRARLGKGSFEADPGMDEMSLAQEVLKASGSPNRLSWMTTWPENHWLFDDGRDAYIAYRIHAGVAIGLADPVAAGERQRAEVLHNFVDEASDSGLTPCVFTVTSEAADLLQDRGWIKLQVAEEAVIDLPTLEFRGKKWQNVRTSLNQAKKAGIRFEMLRLADAPRSIRAQVRAISEEWMGDKGLPEMGFTLGGVDEALDPNTQVGLCIDADGKVHGVTSWMPAYLPGGSLEGWTLDVMRRLPDGFRYTMEFLIASAALEFKEQGLSFLSLSGAPLARSGAGDDEGIDRSSLDRMLDAMGEAMEPYYGFRSLHFFKSKFRPRYEPLFLVVPDEAALPRVGIALGRAYLPDAKAKDLVAMARQPVDEKH